MKDPPIFFSVSHIIKPYNTKLIYGIRYHEIDYFLLKTLGVEDCEQLDNNSRLTPDVLDKICAVITQVEREYKKAPPLEFINIDIFNVLEKDGSPFYGNHKKIKK
ncbi:MAG: hypothetical protein JO080_11170 [Mucilaginibacter sp.]|nr:hypothetical protein [Mucilaginibacter sp.]